MNQVYFETEIGNQIIIGIPYTDGEGGILPIRIRTGINVANGEILVVFDSAEDDGFGKHVSYCPRPNTEEVDQMDQPIVLGTVESLGTVSVKYVISLNKEFKNVITGYIEWS